MRKHKHNVNSMTQAQLELFCLVEDSYDFVEKLINKLPRQRQREHFRNLYIKEYKSVKKDNSIAYKCGNKQRAHANNWLRETLDVRLNKVFAQYGVHIPAFSAFGHQPNFFNDILQMATPEVEERSILDELNKQFKHFAINEYQNYLKQNLVEKNQNAQFAFLTKLHKTGYFYSIKNKTLRDKVIKLVTELYGNEAQQRTNNKQAKYFKREKQKAQMPFYMLAPSRLEQLAVNLANSFTATQCEFFESLKNQGYTLENTTEEQLWDLYIKLFKKCAQACQSLGFPIEEYERLQQGKKVKNERIDTAMKKIVCEKYWLRKMRTLQNRMVEHIAIASGEVRKNVAMYVSNNSFRQWEGEVKKNYDFLREMIIENIEDPAEQVELFDMYLKSSSNPANRRIEMMTRLRGLEEWAEVNGQEALFLTLTAPSKYHATHHTGQQNSKWNGANPRQTHQYLNKVWQQFRALLAKRDIKFYGMRVAEAHHDGTPHWHLLAYVHQKDKAEFIHLFKQKALEIDGDERGAKKRRCKVDECDPKKGSATGYIAKYISKNINGFANDDEVSDEDPNLSLKDNAKRARAWATRWGIRQFQFYGDKFVGVWRELRRLANSNIEVTDEQVEHAMISADMSDYASMMLSLTENGPMSSREEVKLKLHYQEAEQNKYGEKSKRIDGIQSAMQFIKTRLKKWVIKKGTINKTESDTATNTENCSPWTCVSNCNHEKVKVTTQNSESKPKITESIAKMALKALDSLRQSKKKD